MAGQEEKGPLEKPIDWLSSWQASWRFGMPVAVLLALSIASGFVWWNWDDIAKRPGVARVLEWFNERPLPKSTGGRVTIAVTHLVDDKDQ